MEIRSNNIVSVDTSVLKMAENLREKAGFDRCDWAALANEQAIDIIDQAIGEELTAVIDSARNALLDPAQGLAVVDIPFLEGTDQSTEMWVGSLVALIVSRRLYPMRIDPHTSLPFTIYNASIQGERLLKQRGIKYYSPEQNLGFHTDGIVSQKSLLSPNFVSIYNVYIGYKKPGNFYWVPFELWDEFKDWQKKLLGRNFRLEITPITYKHANGDLIVTSDGEFEVSLMCKDGDKVIPFFNGEVIACTSDPEFDIAEVKRMLASLSMNSIRISTPLRSRRLFVLNNWLGAHARDIFEEPIENVKYTRSFFRSMSSKMSLV